MRMLELFDTVPSLGHGAESGATLALMTQVIGKLDTFGTISADAVRTSHVDNVLTHRARERVLTFKTDEA